MSGKLLIYEFNSLPAALAVDRAVAPFDLEVIPVARKNYNKLLEDLIDPWSDVYDEDAETEDYTGPALGGQMIVLCEVEQLDPVLTALREAGVGANCLKAVLTAHNREWDSVKLYHELQQERKVMAEKLRGK